MSGLGMMGAPTMETFDRVCRLAAQATPGRGLSLGAIGDCAALAAAREDVLRAAVAAAYADPDTP